MNKKLLKAYEEFKKELSCKPIISSGYRSPKKNKAVGGAKNSYHLHGKALDLVFPKCLTHFDDIAQIAKKYFNGVIVYPNHIHVDIRKKPYFGKGKY